MCVLSLDDTQWAEVLCRELEYPGVETVEYVTTANLGREPPSTPFVGKINPFCTKETSRSMETCGDLLHLEDCDDTKTVYVKCQGWQRYF